jgi:hypothetical protein
LTRLSKASSAVPYFIFVRFEYSTISVFENYLWSFGAVDGDLACISLLRFANLSGASFVLTVILEFLASVGVIGLVSVSRLSGS